MIKLAKFRPLRKNYSRVTLTLCFSSCNIQGKRVTKQGALPSMGSLLGALDVNNFWQLLDKMAREVPLETPWNAPCALEWDKMTVKQLIDQKCWTR